MCQYAATTSKYRSNGYRTEWSAIWSEIIRLISNQTSVQRMFDFKSQESLRFQSKVSINEVQLPLYQYKIFFRLYSYFIDPVFLRIYRETKKVRNGLKDLLRNSLDTAYYSVRSLWKENSWDNCIEILSYFANHTR